MGIINLNDCKYDKIKISSCYLIPFYQSLLPFSIEITEGKNKTEIIFVSNTKFIKEENVNDFFEQLRNLK